MVKLIQKKVEKVHSQVKAAGEIALGDPVKAVETARTSAECADMQQGAMRQQKTQQLGSRKEGTCPVKPGEIGLYGPTPLLI